MHLRIFIQSEQSEHYWFLLRFFWSNLWQWYFTWPRLNFPSIWKRFSTFRSVSCFFHIGFWLESRDWGVFRELPCICCPGLTLGSYVDDLLWAHFDEFVIQSAIPWKNLDFRQIQKWFLVHYLAWSSLSWSNCQDSLIECTSAIKPSIGTSEQRSIWGLIFLFSNLVSANFKGLILAFIARSSSLMTFSCSSISSWVWKILMLLVKYVFVQN